MEWHTPIVQIDAAVVHFLGRCDIDDRGQRPHTRVVSEGLSVAEQAAHDVVLLPRYPGLPTVGRESNREKVVGQASRFQVAVDGFRVERENDALVDRHAGSVHPGHLTALVGGEETRDVYLAAIVGNRNAARLGPHVGLGEHLTRRRIELQELANGHQGDVGGISHRAHGDADGLRRVGQAETALDDEPVGIDDRYRVVVAMHDPELPFGRERQRLWSLVDGELAHADQVVWVDGRDGVVVLIDGVDSVSFAVVDDRRRRSRAKVREWVVSEMQEERRGAVTVLVDRGHIHRIMAGLREGVGHLRPPRLELAGVAEPPLEGHLTRRVGDHCRENLLLAHDGRRVVRHADLEGKPRCRPRSGSQEHGSRAHSWRAAATGRGFARQRI